MLLTVLSGLITSGLLIPFGKFFRSKWCAVLSLLPLALFCYLLRFIPAASQGIVSYEFHNWVPALNINFDFRMDGLSLLFALLITGIGFLIFVYASSYLRGHKYLDRFFGYLCLFMASMLGIVMSNNILLLFIFWELTSISSFFLIGFNNDNPDSRKSALTALSITGMGGFFLLTGLILIGNIAGSYTITDLIAAADIIKGHELYPVALGFVLVGAFTKSAQFPFHFWLPGAMKAPTPVSAYLHSATMVKAGIFLLARFTPILGGTDLWSYLLMGFGGVTMIYSGVHALLRTDMKSILAYSTIAALGMLTFLLGIGTEAALTAALAFTLAHALYKATLFMTTGIVDHETGTRDISVLRGLRKVLLPVFIAAFVAALSSAGMPLLFGFISKDLIYEATLHAPDHMALYLSAAAILTNICLVAAGFLAGIKPFLGKLPDSYRSVHLPDKAMWIPPLVLAILSLVLGFLPQLAGEHILDGALSVMSKPAAAMHLKVWHGFTIVLGLSLATLVFGTIVYLLNKADGSGMKRLAAFNSLSPEQVMRWLSRRFVDFSEWYTNIMHNGFLRSYLLKIILFAEALFAYELLIGGPIYIDYSKLSALSVYEVVNVLILLAAVVLTVITSSRLTAVVGTSVIGYAICLMFVYYSAPDLAMTQFTIDTLTVVLFVFVLFNLPSFINQANTRVVLRDTIVAITFGALLSLIAIRVLQVPTSIDISNFYAEFAYKLAKGKNVVNVILVDFRGFDTMFEIVVLSIAALGVYSLIKLRLSSSEKE